MIAHRKLLYTRQSACIQPLRSLIERQTHRTLVAWALDCALRPLALFEERRPLEFRPREALTLATAWARGEIKMPVAKYAILAAHTAAGEAVDDPAAEAAARAVAHAAASVHVETHALGLVFYWLTAIAQDTPPDLAEARETEELAWLTERLLHWEAHMDDWNAPWALFLLKDVPNKEQLLHEKG